MTEDAANAPDAEAKQLQRLAERYYDAYKRDHGGDAAPTVEASLMRMMAAMGELSALAFTSSTGMSPFEKDEVSVLIGKLSISVAMIAGAFHLNVARSTLQFLEDELRPSPTSQRPTPRNGKPSTSTSTVNGAASRDATQAGHHSHSQSPPAIVPERDVSVVLSPTSNDAFFRHVDQLAALPRESFDKADLKWVAPLPNGTIEELVPNGRAVRVQYEDFPKYLDYVTRYREARAGPAQQSPAPTQPAVSGAATAPAGVYRDPAPIAYPPARTVSGPGSRPASTAVGVPAVLSQAPGYDPDRESTLYSPSHFAGNLFSPMARASDVQMMNVSPPAAMQEREGNGGSAYERRIRPAVQNIGRPYDTHSFHEKVNLLRRGSVPRAAVAQLGLTFSVPDGQRVVELINDGMQVDVTAANVGEFLRLLDNFPTTQAPSARVHRTNSVRKIEVGRTIPDVAPTFSPSHFSHDLFAPYQEPTAAVYVDYDKSERMLPQYLKEHQGSAADTRGLYVSAARSSDYTTLQRIVQEVKSNPAALTKYGVTFSVPSSMEPYSTAEEQRSGLHALFPSSALQPVRPEDHLHFLSLARQYYPNVL